MPLNLQGNTISTSDITSVGVFKTKVNRQNLLLYLDAGNMNSYPGTGTTWYDLSGNGYVATMQNLTASNWVSVSDVYAFETNDTNDQGFRVSSFPFPLSGRTYELWYNGKTYSIGWQTWFDDNGTEKVLFGADTNKPRVYPDVSPTDTLSINTWYHLAYTMESSAFGQVTVMYKNGIAFFSGVYAQGLAGGTGTLYLLGDSGTEISSGYCSIIRVYDRVLSSYEIAENFQAQRGRFGI